MLVQKTDGASIEHEYRGMNEWIVYVWEDWDGWGYKSETKWIGRNTEIEFKNINDFDTLHMKGCGCSI